jgi:hypothetical protein
MSIFLRHSDVFNTTQKQNARACSGTQNSPRPKKTCMSRSLFKTMLVCFFNHKVTVPYEFFAQGQTVNQQCYSKVLTRLQESVRRKRPGLWPDM